MYLKQYGKYLEAHLIGAKVTNQKQEKILFPFSWPGCGLNPEPFSCTSAAFQSEPSLLFAGYQKFSVAQGLFSIDLNDIFPISAIRFTRRNDSIRIRIQILN